VFCLFVAQLKEISNKSTFPYDIDKVLPK